jgi:5'-AMP-activated protein kinase catalytic alpha subunit
MEYPGDKADMFACGVILYNMRSGKKPFKKAECSDEQYSRVFRGKWDLFWQDAPQIFSEQMKQMVQNLLHPSPFKRYGFENVNFV